MISSNKGKARRGVADGGPDDDGDYATLRELPLITSLDPADDSTSEENKVSLMRVSQLIDVALHKEESW